MSETLSPFGGDNLPFRELPADVAREVSPPNKKIIIAAVSGGLFILLIVVLIFLAPKNQPEPVVVASPPVPSPLVSSPSASDSADFSGVASRLEKLEDNLKALDLSQSQLQFPLIDFKFNFEKDE